jgi:5-(carboxyamino)imidazole ribonucleotide synthase
MRIGVLGGGQLGRMLGLAGTSLGHAFTFLEPAEECPAAVTGAWIRAPFEDAQALADLADRSDLVTYEFENVPVAAVRTLTARVPVHPSAVSLEVGQDRLREKQLFTRLGIPTPRFVAAQGFAELEPAVTGLGLPAMVKTRSQGYDGRGQRLLRDARDVAPALMALGTQPLLVEELIEFQREISVIGVRGRNGELAFYPAIENHHWDGILRLSLAPAPEMSDALKAKAEDYARRVLEALGHVGVLALELFQVGDELLANELAPRVHNSGHWTIEGAIASQFENHLRAIVGQPPGGTAAHGHCAMVNLIGELPDLAPVGSLAGAHVHLYGKRARPGRKLGHVTLMADDPATLAARLAELWPLLGRSAGPLPASPLRAPEAPEERGGVSRGAAG